MSIDTIKNMKWVLPALFLLVFITVGSAGAVTLNLTAGQTTLTMPDSTVVPVWGFSQNGGPVKVPGDPIVVPPGDTILTINLTNNLSEPVSLQIQGQRLSPNSGPVWTDKDSGGNTVTFVGMRPAGNFTARVRSFAHETLPGQTVGYTWINFRPGTFLLTSGTNPAKQVQMGLYAAVKKDAAVGNVAYSGMAPYHRELILLFHEIDPAINAAVIAGNYGPGANPTTGGVTSSIRREPTYFLLNGMAYPDAGLQQVLFARAYDRVLVRFLNAGYDTHIPQLLNGYMTTVAEDGNPYTFSKQQYGYELAAGKTMDAVIKPTRDGHYSIHDAVLNLTNAGAAPGGMLSYYDVGCPGDVNEDGLVTTADLLIVRSDWGRTGCNDPGVVCNGDVNRDGVVTTADLLLMRANWSRFDCPKPLP